MAPVRKVSDRQLELLIDFVERNKHAIQKNKYPMGLGTASVIKVWEELARKLNPLGVKKSAEQWKRYWHLLKCRTKQKAADMRRRAAFFAAQNAVTPSKLHPLTDLEKRVVSAFQEGMPKDMYDDSYITDDVDYEEVTQSSEVDTVDDVMQEVTVNTCKSEMEAETLDEYEIPSSENFDTSLTGEVKRLEDPLTPTVSLRVTASGQGAKGAKIRTAPQVSSSARINRRRIVKVPVHRPNPARYTSSQRGSSYLNHTKDSKQSDSTALREAYKLEERRIAAEERLADAIEGMSATNEGILRCMQQMASTHGQIVYLLQRHLNSTIK